VKTFKILLAWLFGTLILLQFIRVDVPPPPEASENDEVKAPKEVKTILKKACYDCHSNHTKWPWYSYISPVSIEINSNVKNGRAWLNFSIWNKYSEEKREKLLKGIEKAIVWQMPPAGYMWIHKEARLTKEEREIIKNWAEANQKK
jgi:uncharacterized membrane protein